VDSTIVFVAKYFLYLSVALVGVYWLRSSHREKMDIAAHLLIGGVIALALAKLGAHFFYDTRPFVSQHVKPLMPHAPDNGFPSDHALLASFLGFTMLAYSRRFGSLLLIIAVLVGTARVLAHIHSPIDILGSFVFAAIATYVTRYIVHRFFPRWGKKSWRQFRPN
jgi:undecaprenyl-diphosphatase